MPVIVPLLTTKARKAEQNAKAKIVLIAVLILIGLFTKSVISYSIEQQRAEQDANIFKTAYLAKGTLLQEQLFVLGMKPSKYKK